MHLNEESLQIFEKKAGSIKNYGIYLRYLTRTIIVNMYKEYRDSTLNGAVSQMYLEMAGRHSARQESIQIIRTSILEDAQAKRDQTTQYTPLDLRFPKTDQRVRAPTKALSARARAVRPTMIS